MIVEFGILRNLVSIWIKVVINVPFRIVRYSIVRVLSPIKVGGRGCGKSKFCIGLQYLYGNLVIIAFPLWIFLKGEWLRSVHGILYAGVRRKLDRMLYFGVPMLRVFGTIFFQVYGPLILSNPNAWIYGCCCLVDWMIRSWWGLVLLRGYLGWLKWCLCSMHDSFGGKGDVIGLKNILLGSALGQRRARTSICKIAFSMIIFEKICVSFKWMRLGDRGLVELVLVELLVLLQDLL